MGYQVQTFGLDAWNFGSPQSRSRVFISIAAPGLTPLPEPLQTHSHPEQIRGGSLVRTANGLRTGSRYTVRTPFKYLTAADATKDLPPTDGRTSCISFPDHRLARTLSTFNRVCVSCIPRFPGGSTFVTAFKRGYLPQAQIDAYYWDNEIRAGNLSHSWQRVKRNALMPTVTTEPRPEDGVTGNCLHWDDHRLLTIQEARRAQGYPDREVLIGAPTEQWKIVGNSVARPVALALGVSLRTAWLANNALAKPDATCPSESSAGVVHNMDVVQPIAMSGMDVAAGQAARNGWTKHNILNRLTPFLVVPKVLVTNTINSFGNPSTQ